jgi:hypothetical protein
MQQLILTITLVLVSAGLRADFSCLDGTQPACLDHTDKVCPGSTKCVDENASCFDEYPCGSGGGFVCESKYDEMLNNSKETVDKYNKLASENEDLRIERLARKNCVANASTLAEARSCVR